MTFWSSAVPLQVPNSQHCSGGKCTAILSLLLSESSQTLPGVEQSAWPESRALPPACQDQAPDLLRSVSIQRSPYGHTDIASDVACSINISNSKVGLCRLCVFTKQYACLWWWEVFCLMVCVEHFFCEDCIKPFSRVREQDVKLVVLVFLTQKDIPRLTITRHIQYKYPI